MWNLSRMSEVVEELLTIIFRNDVLKLLRLLVRNIGWRLVCDIEGSRVDPFPGLHYKNHTDEMWKAVSEAICS